MKLWSKDNTDTSKQVEKFTVGKDKEFDLQLAPFDVMGSMAHAKMLASVGLLTQEELNAIHQELKNILQLTHDSKLTIDEAVEDIHSLV
jgi:argininosuccinate lyase